MCSVSRLSHRKTTQRSRRVRADERSHSVGGFDSDSFDRRLTLRDGAGGGADDAPSGAVRPHQPHAERHPRNVRRVVRTDSPDDTKPSALADVGDSVRARTTNRERRRKR